MNNTAKTGVRGAVGLLLAVVVSVALPVAAEDVPAIEPLVWAWPHDVVWSVEHGPAWASVGHSATVATIEPIGVKKVDGEAVETRDGTGLIYEVALRVHAVEAFDDATGAPATVGSVMRAQPYRVGRPPPPSEPLEPLVLRADAPEGPKPKRGLHRKMNGNWDFYFGPLPPAEWTAHRHLYLKRSPQFQYCLVVHAAGTLRPMPEAARGTAGSEVAFEELRIYVLVAELLPAPDVKMQLSWPDGEPIPAGIRPSTDWYAKQAVKAPWALRAPRLIGDVGRLTVAPDGGLTFHTPHTTTVELDRRERVRTKALAESDMPKVDTESLSIDTPPEDAEVMRDLEGR